MSIRPGGYASLRTAHRRITEPLARVLARSGVTPNTITILGLAGNVGAAVLAARGDFAVAGVVMLVASALDLMDGSLARVTGRAGPFGAVLDATFDRLSEIAVLAGLLAFYTGRSQNVEAVLIYLTVLGSVMVSYVRAAAEASGASLTEGLFTRAERVILLSIGLIIDQVSVVLWIQAILTQATAFQRFYLVYRRLSGQPDEVEDAGERS